MFKLFLLLCLLSVITSHFADGLQVPNPQPGPAPRPPSHNWFPATVPRQRYPIQPQKRFVRQVPNPQPGRHPVLLLSFHLTMVYTLEDALDRRTTLE